jgi:hypothetical protein
MKNLMLLSVLFIISSEVFAAADTNNLAKNLAVGTRFEVLKDINFPHQITMTRIQNGKISVDVDIYRSFCDLDMMDNSYDPETGYVQTIKKGTVFSLDRHHDSDASKGSTGFFIKSNEGRDFHMQCRRGMNFANRVSSVFGQNIFYADNVFQLRVNQMKRILKEVITFKSE